MRVPSVVARNLIAYITARGKESVKATVMLNAMGWLPDGTKAPPDVVEKARLIWQGKDMKQSSFDLTVDKLEPAEQWKPGSEIPL